jgi:Zn-dependent M28 family amino/carboxypeptidase
MHVRGAERTVTAILLAAALVGCASVNPSTMPSASGSATLPSPSAVVPLSPGTRLDAADIASSITEDGLRSRLDALAAVSDADAGYRAVGTAGYDAAADLVDGDLRDAGWTVHSHSFFMPAFADPGGSELVVGGTTFALRDILPLIYAPPGDVSGPVVAIDWAGGALGPTGKGCAVGDYGALPAGAIVVVRSGPCYRRDQILAAQDAGAAGFVAAYPQAGPGAALRPTLIDPTGLRIPAVGASRPVAEAMVQAAEVNGTAHLVTDASSERASTRSIVADLPGSDPGRVVMLGAHLDSVVDGPGINDNGSGVAALLELADALGGRVPGATIRLAFWAGEELGLRGSSQYLRDRSQDERDRIVAYLNADMLASPNGIAGVYDEPRAAQGSAAIRDLLMSAVERHGGAPEPVDVGGGSDHQPFIQAGIPTGGVFSGANEVISAAQAQASGAREGQPADPCYHQPCDDGSALDITLARRLAAALADVAVQLSNDDSLPGSQGG